MDRRAQSLAVKLLRKSPLLQILLSRRPLRDLILKHTAPLPPLVRSRDGRDMSNRKQVPSPRQSAWKLRLHSGPRPRRLFLKLQRRTVLDMSIARTSRRPVTKRFPAVHLKQPPIIMIPLRCASPRSARHNLHLRPIYRPLPLLPPLTIMHSLQRSAVAE